MGRRAGGCVDGEGGGWRGRACGRGSGWDGRNTKDIRSCAISSIASAVGQQREATPTHPPAGPPTCRHHPPTRPPTRVHHPHAHPLTHLPGACSFPTPPPRPFHGPPARWVEDPRWRGAQGGGNPANVAHVAAHPSRWAPSGYSAASAAAARRAAASGSGPAAGHGAQQRGHQARGGAGAGRAPGGASPSSANLMGWRLVDRLEVPRRRSPA